MLISFEGLDGVGKTTVVGKVAKELGLPIIEKPIKKLLELSKEQSTNITKKIYSEYSSNVQALYYLMGYLTAYEDAKKTDVLMDRGFLSTYYFSCCPENNAIFDHFASSYGLPELTILLYASTEERIKRIQNRNSSDRDLKRKRIYRDNYDKFFEGIKKYNIPYILIDTEKLTEIETVKIVLKILSIWLSNKDKQKDLEQFFSMENMGYLHDLSYDEVNKIVDEIKMSEDDTKRLEKEI